MKMVLQEAAWDAETPQICGLGSRGVLEESASQGTRPSQVKAVWFGRLDLRRTDIGTRRPPEWAGSSGHGLGPE